MRVGIIFVFMDFHRKGRKYHGVLQNVPELLRRGFLFPAIGGGAAARGHRLKEEYR